VPRSIAEGCVTLLSALETIGRLGTRHATADIRASLLLTDTALAGAIEMVKANTGLMKDRERAATIDAETIELRRRGSAAHAAASAARESTLS
jgi:formiminotetrahydrofolate cyclodeaminase